MVAYFRSSAGSIGKFVLQVMVIERSKLKFELQNLKLRF